MSAALDQASRALELSVQSIGAVLASRRRQTQGSLRVLFVSPRHGDGTTTVAACTGLSLCQNLRTEIALVEANPFSPALSSYANCPPTPGFTEWLRAEASEPHALRMSPTPGLSLLPAGRMRDAELIDWRGVRARQLFEDELRAVPFAFLDAPPLLDRPVGRLLFEFADLVVLVVRAGRTTKADVRAALQILREANVPPAGVVLNRFKKPLPFL